MTGVNGRVRVQVLAQFWDAGESHSLETVSGIWSSELFSVVPGTARPPLPYPVLHSSLEKTFP